MKHLTRLNQLRNKRNRVDRSVRGTPEERAKHQLDTLEAWRPIRGKDCRKVDVNINHRPISDLALQGWQKTGQ